MTGLLWKGTVAHNRYSETSSKNLWGMPSSYPYSVELHRSSHRRCSKTKGVLNIFEKFTEKHLSQSPFFNKVAALRSEKRENRETLVQLFSYEFWKNFKNSYLLTTACGCRLENHIEIEPQGFTTFILSCLH